MKRMLINATQPEEVRVALVDGQRLYDLDIEATGGKQKKSNIYKGRVVRVEPSLEAAFVDYGAERHGFLPLKEISREYFREDAKSGGRPSIREAIREGQEMVVQVEKEERGNKGAALTTFVSLAGRYLVAMPKNPRAGGVSRQIAGDDREEAREAMAALEVPDDFGIILRTAGVGKSAEELQWDLDYLLTLWKAIEAAAGSGPAPMLIFEDSSVAIRAIRDYLRDDISEILVDSKQVYESAEDFMQQVMPHNLRKLKHYEDPTPLFTRYQIEGQIESAFAREVRLPSGGAIVVEATEALVTIDINSARSTKGADIEETAFHTNLEAADEIGTQLRIRDIGGLIVVDFIDMLSSKNQRAVENRLREAVRPDRARVQIGKISRFGLLEMSRQRLRPSLAEFSHIACPRCDGVGVIRATRSTALAVLRLLEEEAMKDSTARVVAQVPVDVATFLLNEKRNDVTGIESRQGIQILLIPNQNLETPKFEIQRVREQDLPNQPDTESYEMVAEVEVQEVVGESLAPTTPREKPAVTEVKRTQPKPQATPAPEPVEQKRLPPAGGFFKRLVSGLLGAAKAEPEPTAPTEAPPRQRTKKSPSQKRPTSRRTRGARDEQTDSASSKPSGNRASQSGQERGERPRAEASSTESKNAAADTSHKENARAANPDTTEEGQGSSSNSSSGRSSRRRRGGRRRGGQGRRTQSGENPSNAPTEGAVSDRDNPTTGDEDRSHDGGMPAEANVGANADTGTGNARAPARQQARDAASLTASVSADEKHPASDSADENKALDRRASDRSGVRSSADKAPESVSESVAAPAVASASTEPGTHATEGPTVLAGATSSAASSSAATGATPRSRPAEVPNASTNPAPDSAPKPATDTASKPAPSAASEPASAGESAPKAATASSGSPASSAAQAKPAAPAPAASGESVSATTGGEKTVSARDHVPD